MACASSCTCHDCASPELPGVFAALRLPTPTPAEDPIARMWADTEARQTRGFGALDPREPPATPAPAWRPQPVALPQAGASVNLRRPRVQKIRAHQYTEEIANYLRDFGTPSPLPIGFGAEPRQTAAERLRQRPNLLESSHPTRLQDHTKDLDRCDGWDRNYAYAAPLIDPAVASGSSLCPSEADTRWRLYTTSPAFATLGNGQQRMYFFDGTLRNPAEDPANTPWPKEVYFSDGTSRPKFNEQPSTTESQTDDQWWRAEHTAGQRVSTLCFSKQFIAFLDSEDGEIFNLFTPLLVNPSGANRCDFSGASVHYAWVEVHNQQLSIRRAGWNSTVIPCHYASVVYKVDSVLHVPIPDANPVWVMFAVRCSGAGLGADGTDLEEGLNGACPLCSPSADDTTNCARPTQQTPVTDYVLFVSESPDFRAGTLGPFGLLPSKPADDAGQWVGVPQAWMSDDGRFVFYYVHPNRGPDGQPAAYEGLNVARVADFGIRLGLAWMNHRRSAATDSELHPGLDVLEVLEQIEQSREIISPAFRNLGNIAVCRQDLEDLSHGDPWVDEHFVFCEGRLHLYYTHLGEFVDKPRDEPRLDAIYRASARAEFSSIGLDLFLASGASIVPDWIDEMLLRFRLADCAPFSADDIRSELEAEPQVNDPTVHFGVGSNRGRIVMHFFSEAELALLVITADRPCGEGRCVPEYDTKHTQPIGLAQDYVPPVMP